ncbi:MAG: hypothetical protein INR71_02730, partial [Terriglobus roseus]|nr:hypothetical protein [Terriglobus roseus]
MRLLSIPQAVLGLTILLTSSSVTSASPLQGEERDATILQNSTLAVRDCAAANVCGANQQLCCLSTETCITNALDQAECITGAATSAGAAAVATTVAAGDGGYWSTYITTWVETGYVTLTATTSQYVSAAAA